MRLSDNFDLVMLVQKYRKICLCGSTRFLGDFLVWNKRLTMAGGVVYSIGSVLPAKDGENSEIGFILDRIHKKKIASSDAILVLDLQGYLGDSTKSEMAFAEEFNIPVVLLSEIVPEAGPTGIREALEEAYSLFIGVQYEDHEVYGYVPYFNLER